MEQNTIPSVFEEMAQARKDYVYATTGQRFVNFIVDLVVYLLYNLLVVATLSFFFRQDEVFTISGLWLVLFTMCNYFTVNFLIEGVSGGRSFGKLITGTKAVTDDITCITWKDALIRSLCRLIPFEPFSGLGGYPWHDQFSRTKVIKNQMLQQY